MKTTPEAIRKRMQTDVALKIKTLWGMTFNLPPNDERLSALMLHEALEQVLARKALEEEHAKAAALQMRRKLASQMRALDDNVEVDTSEEARELADTPHLTGDPEWDAIELAETDPSKPPIEW